MFVWDHSHHFIIPVINCEMSFYTFFFTAGVLISLIIGYSVFCRYLSVSGYLKSKTNLKKYFIKESLVCGILLIVSSFLGARIGHFLFYEGSSVYASRPWILLYIWQGGRSSHGAIIAMLFTCFFISRYIRSQHPDLTFFRIMDFGAVSSPFCIGLIRVGNFFNQEILGHPTDLPWGVLFSNPMVGKPISSFLHPVQLYEAFFCFAAFIVLWILSYQPRYLLKEGRLAGLSMVLISVSRFFCEDFKMEVSHIMPEGFFLTTGQILSLPFILFGLFVYYKDAILTKFFGRVSE